MKTSVSILWLVFTFGTSTLSSCGVSDTAQHLGDGTQGQALVVYGDEPAPAPSGVWGVCNLDWVCSEPAIGCLGWVDPSVCEADESCIVERVLVSCFHACETDADCPVPVGGDVTPVCDAGVCHLPCDGGAACPDGFTCVPPLPNTEQYNVEPAGACMQTQGPEGGSSSPMPNGE